MKTADPQFNPERLPVVLEAKGAVVQEFLEQSQCRTTRALDKANRAAFVSWSELVVADVATYHAESLRLLA